MLLTFFSSRASILLQSSKTSSQCVCRRYLFSEEVLRLKPFCEEANKVKKAIAGREDIFWKRFELLVEKGEAPENDLKLACFLAKKEDTFLIKQMLKRYTQTVRVGSYFRFGPHLMRRLHQLNLPDTAIEFFDDESLVPQFAYSGSINLYLDLLFENQRYEEIARSFERWLDTENQVACTSKHIKSVYLLSLYKIGSPEAFEKADRYWEKQPKDVVHLVKTILTYAAIQLKNMKPEKTLFVIARTNWKKPNKLRYNMQIQAHIRLGDWKMVENLLQELASRQSCILSETRDMIIQEGKNPISLNLLKTCSGISTVDEGLCEAQKFTNKRE